MGARREVKYLRSRESERAPASLSRADEGSCDSRCLGRAMPGGVNEVPTVEAK